MEMKVQGLLLTAIDPPADAHRLGHDEQRLGELADSLASEGLHQPIGVRGPTADGRFEIVYGHRRYLAARMLGWPTMEAHVYALDADTLTIRASENLNREQLSAAEESAVCGRFRTAGFSRAETARRLRHSVSWVDTRLALLECPEDVRAAVHAGALSIGVATQFAGVDHAPYRRELIAEAARTGCTVLQASAWVAAYAADRERIAQNLVTVEEIASSREAWVLKIACDACGVEANYPDTRAMRFCLACTNTLLAALSAETTA